MKVKLRVIAILMIMTMITVNFVCAVEQKELNVALGSTVPGAVSGAVSGATVGSDSTRVETPDKPNLPTWNENEGDPVPDNIKNVMKDVWATISTLVQFAAVGCVVFAGLRYMFASADQKADIKSSMIYLAVGAIIVFGATKIIEMIAKAAESTL